MKKKVLFLIIACFIASIASAQTVFLGDWITIDDESGAKKSVVKIWQGKNGFYYGKITSLFEDPNAICTECTGGDHNKPMMELIIIRDMEYEDGCLKGGKVLDPNNGKFYFAKITLNNGKLILRGSLDKFGVLGRSQTWIRK
jgi:uncharacterized protein (DUF2147 family)